MKCPVCGSLNFFVKDPDDEFETHEFELKSDSVVFDWAFQTGCFAPGSARNDRGTSRPCPLPPMAVKFKPPALRVVVDSEAEDSGRPDVKADTEIFCEKCAWHDKFQELKNR